jgi:hypothetical protein
MSIPQFWSATNTQESLSLAGSIFGSLSNLVIFAVGLGIAVLIVAFIIDRFF